MDEELLVCKHGLHKVTCNYCKEFSDEIVIADKHESTSKKNWQSSSFYDNSAHNSASGDQEYDLEEEFMDYDNDTDIE